MLRESQSSLSICNHKFINSLQRSNESLISSEGLPVIFAPLKCVNRALLMSLKNASDEGLDRHDLICRICLGGNSSGDLLMPCHCKGSIALAHLRCLEIWLSESNRNQCELCQYTFRIVREPQYNVLWSILVFLRHPGEHAWDLVFDLMTLTIYTPSTVTSTYMLMLLCESIAKSELKFRQSIVSHTMAFTAIFGIAAINFTYTSWLILTIEKYVDLWKEWYQRNGTLHVILSENKLIPRQKKRCFPVVISN